MRRVRRVWRGGGRRQRGEREGSKTEVEFRTLHMSGSRGRAVLRMWIVSRARSLSLSATQADRQTDTQTHINTHTDGRTDIHNTHTLSLSLSLSLTHTHRAGGKHCMYVCMYLLQVLSKGAASFTHE